jgi:hypothetical protein
MKHIFTKEKLEEMHKTCIAASFGLPSIQDFTNLLKDMDALLAKLIEVYDET